MPQTSTQAKIRTLFWDIGGVLLTNGWDVDQRAGVLTRLGVDLAKYEAVHDQHNYFWERGLSDARTFFQKTIFDLNPHLNLDFETLWPQVCAQSRVIHPECLDMLSELQQAGQISIATLNNESRELNDFRLDAFHLRPLFDYFICSGYVHEMKPHPGIYRSAIEISGHLPESSLFIDDKRENCDAAIALGMNAIRFESPAQLLAELAEYGVEVSWAAPQLALD